MEEKIIQNENEEIIETEETALVADSKDGKKFGAISVAALVGAGYLFYKKGIKPMIAKHKAKKESKNEDSDECIDVIIEDDE